VTELGGLATQRARRWATALGVEAAFDAENFKVSESALTVESPRFVQEIDS
jgi:hypothetical protein